MIVAIAGELQMDQPRSLHYTEYGSEELSEMNMTESCPEGAAVGEGRTDRGAFQVL